MANIADFTNALFDAVNTGVNIKEDYITKEAQQSTRNKQIQLKADIQQQMDEIRRSSTSDQWQTKINDYFQSVKSSMSNKNSLYYCKNNLQADMFNNILDEAQLTVSNEVRNLVFKADRDKALVDYQNSLETLAQTETPENYLRLANEGAKNLFDLGFIDETQLQQQYNTNFDRGYINTAMKMFNITAEAAIKRGDSEETVIDMVFQNMPQLMATDTAGLPKLRDTTQLKETLTKDMKQQFRAKQQDIWNQTEKKCAQIYDSIMDQRTAEGRNTQRLSGRVFLDSVKNTGMISPDQLRRWTGLFALEDYYSPEGTTTSSQRKAAAKKMDPEDRIKFYLNAVENSDETTTYNAKKDLFDELLDEFKAYIGNQNATIMDLKEAYPSIDEFLKQAKSRLPSDFKDVVSFAESVIKSTLNTKGDKEAYKSEINSTLDLVYDILFDADLKNLGPEAKKDLKTRVVRAINANLGGVLQKQKDYKQYFDKDYAGIETLSDYRIGVIQGDEARMAQAMKERDANPDLVYTKENGVEVPYALKEGLARLENDERSQLKELLIDRMGADNLKAFIEHQTGQQVKNLDEDFNKIVKATYESDGKNDVTARRRYTINGIDYRFRTDDGKHIILEEKKNGTNDEWKQTRTVSQQKEYDSPKAVAKRTEKEVTNIVNKTDWKKTSIPEGGFTYTDDNGNQQKLTYTDPEGEEKVINQAYWKSIRANEKKRIIMDWMEKDPEAAKKWLDMLEAK